MVIVVLSVNAHSGVVCYILLETGAKAKAWQSKESGEHACSSSVVTCRFSFEVFGIAPVAC